MPDKKDLFLRRKGSFFAVLYFPDDAAGDFFAGIARGLGGEIVRPAVNDDCAAKNLRDAEAPGEHGHIRLPIAGKEGWQIPGVIGMQAIAGIKVAAGICKFLAGAGGSLMDMEAKNTGSTGTVSHGKPGHIGDYNGARVGGEEGHRAGKARGFRASLEPGNGNRTAIAKFCHDGSPPSNYMRPA